MGLLLLCVRYPLLAWRIGFASVVLIPLFVGGERISLELAAALLVCFWVAGLRHGRAAAWAMAVVMLVPTWFWLKPGIDRRAEATVVLLVAALALDATLASRRAGHELADQVARSELDEARRALLEERTRIAREMHDVVAHHMSLIAVQAETAPYRVNALSPAAREEFAALSATAREALSDLRRLLGVLRSDSPAEREPQPQLADVVALVEATPTRWSERRALDARERERERLSCGRALRLPHRPRSALKRRPPRARLRRGRHGRTRQRRAPSRCRQRPTSDSRSRPKAAGPATASPVCASASRSSAARSRRGQTRAAASRSPRCSRWRRWRRT